MSGIRNLAVHLSVGKHPGAGVRAVGTVVDLSGTRKRGEGGAGGGGGNEDTATDFHDACRRLLVNNQIRTLVAMRESSSIPVHGRITSWRLSVATRMRRHWPLTDAISWLVLLALAQRILDAHVSHVLLHCPAKSSLCFTGNGARFTTGCVF